MNTLRGVFPEPKPVYRKNFIKENVKYVRKIQEMHQKPEPPLTSLFKKDKYSDVQARYQNVSPSLKDPRMIVSASEQTSKNTIKVKRSNTNPTTKTDDNQETCDRAIQAEYDEIIKDITKVNKTLTANSKSKSKSPTMSGDVNEKVVDKLETLKLSEEFPTKNKIGETRGHAEVQSTGVPTGYKRGKIPKYIIERQKEAERPKPSDPDCPPGHVPVPDAERKETLRALRQSYADLISQLNSLPVRTDTLRTRNRKTELEKQLDKIEEGIKVFSRPKVYVKINS